MTARILEFPSAAHDSSHVPGLRKTAAVIALAGIALTSVYIAAAAVEGKPPRQHRAPGNRMPVISAAP